jgi:N-acetylneuraminate synthase
MRDMFNCEIGLSDHTMGIGVSVASIALGATVIEKHFTLNRDEGGVDSTFSMEPHEFASLVSESQKAWLSLGKVNYGPTEAEHKSMQFRRSLYITQDLDAGDKLTVENLRAIRPGLGLPPKYIDLLLGKKIAKSVLKGTPLSWDLIGE